jgi:DNA-binding transcriptional MerR regulator
LVLPTRSTRRWDARSGDPGVPLDGVALAAIQALIQKVETQQAELRGTDARRAALEQYNQILEARLNKIERALGEQTGNPSSIQPTS